MRQSANFITVSTQHWCVTLQEKTNKQSFEFPRKTWNNKQRISSIASPNNHTRAIENICERKVIYTRPAKLNRPPSKGYIEDWIGLGERIRAIYLQEVAGRKKDIFTDVIDNMAAPVISMMSSHLAKREREREREGILRDIVICCRDFNEKKKKYQGMCGELKKYLVWGSHWSWTVIRSI